MEEGRWREPGGGRGCGKGHTQDDSGDLNCQDSLGLGRRGGRGSVSDDSQRPGLGNRVEGWALVEKKTREERGSGEKRTF